MDGLNRHYWNVLFPIWLICFVSCLRSQTSPVEITKIPQNIYSLATVFQACHSCPHRFGFLHQLFQYNHINDYHSSVFMKFWSKFNWKSDKDLNRPSEIVLNFANSISSEKDKIKAVKRNLTGVVLERSQICRRRVWTEAFPWQDVY